MKTEHHVYAAFENLGISYASFEHPPVFAAAESEKILGGVPGLEKGLSLKSLFLRDKKKKRLWMVVTVGETRVDLKLMKPLLGATGNLSFGDAELLWGVLGVRPGSISPLALLNHEQRRVELWLDRRMEGAVVLNMHPTRNDRTVQIDSASLMRFLAWLEAHPNWFDASQFTPTSQRS